MKSVLQPVEQYYTAKLREHGESAKGVDWNGEESQALRFDQLARIIQRDSGFSLNDLGCGYGAFFAHLDASYRTFTYRGIDVSAEMVAAARQRYGRDPRASFHVGDACDQAADYSVASGIFKDKVRQARDAGASVLLVSHTLSELEELADDIVFLLEGRVRFHGPLASLIELTGLANLERAVASLMRERTA